MRRKLTAEPVRNKPGWLAVPCRSSDEAKITCKACGTRLWHGVVQRGCGTGLWHGVVVRDVTGFLVRVRLQEASVQREGRVQCVVRGQSICRVHAACPVQHPVSRARAEGRQRATAGAHSLNRQRRIDAGYLARGRAHPRSHPRRQLGGLRSAWAHLGRRQLQLERLGEVPAHGIGWPRFGTHVERLRAQTGARRARLLLLSEGTPDVGHLRRGGSSRTG